MRSAPKEERGSQAGITIIELLIAMIIFTIVSTMLVGTWITLQRAYASTVRANTAQATARDAIGRISSELRDAQPTTLGTATPTPAAAPVYIDAKPMEVSFYSAYNQAGAQNDTTGVSAMRLTRIWLDTATVLPPPAKPECKTLYWQRRTDTSTSGAWTDASVRKVVLGQNVVNNSVPDTSVTPTTAYTPIFMYAYRDGTGAIKWTDNSAGTLDLKTIISVRVRLIVDANLSHSPTYVDLSTTVRPRNSSGN
jgi:type II secretory pathway pseudopilin PulG